MSDFTDALTGRPTQVLAASLLLFIANVTKIITFGGVMGEMLEGRMVRHVKIGSTHRYRLLHGLLDRPWYLSSLEWHILNV